MILRSAHDGPGVGRVQKGSAISLRFFQNKMASTELNERKSFRSSSDSDVTLSPGSEPRRRKFEVSEEEWLSVLQRVKDLEAKQLIDTKRIENLSTELTASQEENGALKRKLMALQDSLEFSQKEQDEVKGRVEWRSMLFPTRTGLSRSVGILSKIRYYVSTEILMNLYYALVYPFIMYV